MKDKQPLKEQMDNLIPKLQQIDNHALSKADAHTKELYMNLLAAIAFEDREVSEKEKRYLHALCNGIKEIEYKTMISGIDRIGDHLDETLKVIEKNDLKFWLFIDALILCRLDSEITEKESALLGSLADSLKLTHQEVSLCLKLATIILSQDEEMLYELIPEVPEDFPFYALHEAYNKPWFSAKFSLAEDLAEGRELKGKYFIHKSVRISGMRELDNLYLVFSDGTSITVENEAKLKITGSKLSQARIICSERSSLSFDNCNFTGGKGIYCGIGSSLSVSQCKFDNVRIVSDKASHIALDEVSFENLIDKRAMSLTNCKNVSIKKSKFNSCGYGVKNAEKEEGGALLIRDCTLSIDTCTFENCTASGDGGAISFWNASYGIKDSKFIECRSGLNGGAIVVHDTIKMLHGMKDLQPIFGFLFMSDYGQGVPKIIDVEFIGCAAANFGGAVMSYTRQLRFAQCLFEKCSAPNRGGGATIIGSEDTSNYNRFFDCRFIENSAIDGNGLWMELFQVYSLEQQDIYKSTFHKCTTNMNPQVNCNPRYYSEHLSKHNKFTI